ncbi:uncharacterized protein LOC144345724 [Saccoglossus kowalevskii]
MCQWSTNAVCHILRNQGHKVINYIDDFGGAELPINDTAAFESLGNLLNELGLQESVAKTCAPATSMTFLGSEFDTVNMTIAVPATKLTQIHEELSNWDNRSSCSRTELQSLIGLLAYVSNCVRPGHLFISRMLSTLRTFTAKHSRTRIDAEFRKDLLWWKTFLEDYNSVSIIHTQPWSPPDTVVCTDACLSGCGGVSVTQFIRFPSPQHIINMGLSINALELLAVVVTLKLWSHTWSGLRLQITSDNTTMVAFINSHRTHSDFILPSTFRIQSLGCTHPRSEQCCRRSKPFTFIWHL